jgi:drug/metabolite transporter (DMT)-like permease
MIYGLGAALGWGLADFGVALVSRRIGSFVTLVVAQLAGIVLFTVLLALPAFRLPHWHPGLLVLPLIGVLGALSYVSFYRALELGPIALVSPIAAGYAAIVIGLALVFLGERVPALALVGAGLIIVGVILASIDLRLPTEEGPGQNGLLFAVLAMAGFGVGAFLIGALAKDAGWFGAIYLSRLGSAATLLIIVAATDRSGFASTRWTAMAPALLLGVLDIAGFAAYARGGELGHVSITAAASVSYPLIPILGGVLYFRERPAATQALGVALVIGGLVILAFGH